ncbi:MAG TPA: hypothetical protein VD793_11055, partial [Gemmatimonadales bacterium]|nr:hypothetical protein [Gemmatimonadales bacterium]
LEAGMPGDGDRPVTVEHVSMFVGVRRGETPQDWVDAVVARDVVRAASLLDAVLAQAGVTAVRLLSALGTELVGIRLAVALGQEEISGARLRQAILQELKATRPVGLGDWSACTARWSAAAAWWSTSELDQALEAAFAADQALKSTTVSDEQGILRGLILGLHRREAVA